MTLPTTATAIRLRRAHHQPGQAHGFTLIEILAATSIMVLITFFILSMTTNVLTGWSASKSALTANYEAKIALDKLAQDIESAIFRRNGNEWFVIESNHSADTPGSLRLMFYASIPDRPHDAGGGRSPSDVCAVNYRMLFRNIFDPNREQLGSRDFALYRTVATPRDTFDIALAETSPRYYWEDVDSALTQHLLSRDVAAIRIDAAYEDGEGVLVLAEDIQTLIIGDTITIDGSTNATRVRYLDISIGVLGEEGSLAFHYDPELPGGTQADGTPPTVGRINAAIERYGNWYTRRVVIRSTPL